MYNSLHSPSSLHGSGGNVPKFQVISLIIDHVRVFNILRQEIEQIGGIKK